MSDTTYTIWFDDARNTVYWNLHKWTTRRVEYVADGPGWFKLKVFVPPVRLFIGEDMIEKGDLTAVAFKHEGMIWCFQDAIITNDYNVLVNYIEFACVDRESRIVKFNASAPQFQGDDWYRVAAEQARQIDDVQDALGGHR